MELYNHNGAPAAPTGLLEQARHLSQLGRYLDLQALLPELQQHADMEARVLAARAIGHLGARRRSEALHLQLWRHDRSSARAMVEMLRAVVYRRGAYQGWRLMNSLQLPGDAGDEVAADWHSLTAFMLGSMRLFDESEQSFAAACRLRPDESWIHVEWSYVCELRDRYDEALEHAGRALQLRPGARSALLALSRIQMLVGREDEAMAMLEQALPATQAASLAMALFELQFERGLHREAEASLALARAWSPLADKTVRPWLEARHADVALALGRYDEAREHAVRAGGPFYEDLARRLATGDVGGRRVELPVGFVRQHYNTCAPATLATLCRYWGHDAQHLEIAEQICYDGTPHHNERRWVEEQGLEAREFTVDWDSARALIDAGVPFTLTTVFPGSGHLQAVIGYDALRGTLLIRDPFKRTFTEFEARSLFDSHRSSGPRGMLLLPPRELARIAAIELPDGALWDAHHQVMRALSRHRRGEAEAAVLALNARHATHRLALSARRAMASYDGDRQSELSCVEALLEQFPDDANLRLAKAGLLGLLASRAQQQAWLQHIASGVAADPVALTRHADFLLDDGRELGNAVRLYERALSLNPGLASAWSGLASARWQAGDRKAARFLSRAGACLEETNEGLAETHFRTCRFLGEAQAGLDFLRERARRLRGKAAGPVMTLFIQLEQLERTAEAFEMLEAAIQRRPADGDLLLFGADARLRYGQREQALALLVRAEPVANRVAWLKLKARWLREDGQPQQALVQAREACLLEPLDAGAHRLVATLLHQCEGRAAALAHLRAMAEGQQHRLDLQELFIGWLGADEREEAVRVLQRLLQVNPTHAWAHRELATKLALERQFEPAWASAQAALAVAPHQSSTHSTLGFVRLREGRLDEARAHLRDALVLSVDNDYAIGTLVEVEQTHLERVAALEFVRGELKRQVTLGDGLLTFWECAQHVLEPAELRAMLEDMHRTRPDLWQAWAALGMQLVRDGEHPRAIDWFQQAIERFSLLPRLHFEKARAQALCGEREAARASLRDALAINPVWSKAVRLFVETVMDEGRGFERALEVLEAALHRTPEDTELQAQRAQVRRRMGQSPQALEDLRAALRLDPSTRWPWDLFCDLARELGEPQAARELAQEVTQRHAGNVDAWLRLAEQCEDAQQALDAYDKGLSLEPRHETAFAAKLQVLLRAQRLDEARQALASAPWPPQALPVGVAVCEARLARAGGQHAEALAMLSRLLERDPNNYLLWQESADWNDQQDRHDDYLKAATHLVRLAPHHPPARGYLGHALEKAGRAEEACEQYQRALVIDPAYLFGGLRLADLQLKRGELDAAQATLDLVRPHGRGMAVPLRDLELAAARHDEAAAADHLAAVIGRRFEDDERCQQALELIQREGWEAMALRVIRQVVDAGPCARPACRFWIARQGRGLRRLVPGSFYRDVQRALKVDPSHSLKSDFLDHLGRSPDGVLLDRLMREHAAVLRRDTECWGMVSFAYLQHRRPREAVRWMHDWRERADAPAWALDNLALALRQLGDDATAEAVTRRSLSLEPSNPEADVWLAVDAALADRLDDLERHIDRIDVASLRHFYRNLVTALGAYRDAVRSGDSRKALARFAALRMHGGGKEVLGRLLRTFSARLVARHTPAWKRGWRWLQFRAGMTG
jgi:tetratricopeptide (TPR) repeat protein